MKNDQREYIAYVKAFAETNRDHIWLGGSFLRGNPTPFSDVDISAYMGVDSLLEFLVQSLQFSRSSAKDIFHKYMTIL